MIQITPHMRILLAVEPVDFRKGIDGLAQLCRQKLQSDPMTGAVFVFSNRRRKALKILCYDGQGFGSAKNGSPKVASRGGLGGATARLAGWMFTNCNSCCWKRSSIPNDFEEAVTAPPTGGLSV